MCRSLGGVFFFAPLEPSPTVVVISQDQLQKRRFTVRPLGVVWPDALCIEQTGGHARAAVCVENAGESKEEWELVKTKQSFMERAGWSSYRVNLLSLIFDYSGTMSDLAVFLDSAGLSGLNREGNPARKQGNEDTDFQDEAQGSEFMAGSRSTALSQNNNEEKEVQHAESSNRKESSGAAVVGPARESGRGYTFDQWEHRPNPNRHDKVNSTESPERKRQRR